MCLNHKLIDNFGKPKSKIFIKKMKPTLTHFLKNGADFKTVGVRQRKCMISILISAVFPTLISH